MGRQKIKLQFDTAFQQEVLHYIVKEVTGYRVLNFFHYDAFELLEHQVIAYALKKYFRKNHKVPSKALFREYLRVIFKDKTFEENLDKDLKELILKITESIYEEPLLDSPEVYSKIKEFKQFCELKTIIEGADFQNFEVSHFSMMSGKIQKALALGEEHEDNDGTFVMKDIYDRQVKRKIKSSIVPTPYWQLNQTTNAGGWESGSLICFIGKAKWFKTGMLINYTADSSRTRKKIAYIDFENNEEPLAVRTEQKISKLSKAEVISGENDKRIAKIMRQYKRIGAEVVIKRFPAYVTTFEDIQVWVDKMKLKHGVIFDGFVFDYLGLMGSISRKKEEKDRISDVYVDAKNFLQFNNIPWGITGHHIKDEGHSRIGTKFKPTDTAKCLDIHRHVDALIGLNQSEEEREAGIIRMEIIDQRDGRDGSCLFWIDFEKQTLKEFSKREVKEYHKTMDGDNKNTRKSDGDL